MEEEHEMEENLSFSASENNESMSRCSQMISSSSRSSNNKKESGKCDGNVSDDQKQVARETSRKQFLDNLKSVEKEKLSRKQSMEDPLGRSMKYLLKQADLYAHFLLTREETVSKKKKKKQQQQIVNEKKRGQFNEQEEKEDLEIVRLEQQPSILKHQLKHFQLNGLNWLINLYEIGINGILADEMGLGKTIQTISLFAYLKEFKKISGPHLIIAPKSTLGNWCAEFKQSLFILLLIRKWLPALRVLKLVAVKEEREEILKNHLKLGKFDVCVTSYEGVNICRTNLQKFEFKYVVVDEAHRIKNEEAMLSMNIRKFETRNKLLLTGTPLQNNLHELWSLLNFLLPDLFHSSDVFDSWFQEGAGGAITSAEGQEANEANEKELREKKNLEMVTQLHKILKPFMLRRTKKEVEKSIPPKKEIYLYVGLTEKQIELYQNLLLNKNISESGENKSVFLNIIMQLRKVCNHPYLFEGVEEEGLPPHGEHLITSCGKLIVLDKLITKLLADTTRHQILVFSQMTKMLDILEDYCYFRQYKYCRIDGDTDMQSRDRQLSLFTEPNSQFVIFLLSTRAGGLGINLATADTVVLYDSDWNPQVDLQAMDRAHRIGQQNPVNVYRLITENSIEEKIIERQVVKLKWDSLVIQRGSLTQKSQAFTKDQLKDMIQFGANMIFKSNSGTITDEDIDALLIRGEEKARTQKQELDQQLSKYSDILDLSQGHFDIYDFQNINYQKKKEDLAAIQEAQVKEIESKDFAVRTRGERKALTNFTGFDNTDIKAIQSTYQPKPKIPKLYDHQLFLNKDRINELLLKEAEEKIIHKGKPPEGQEFYLSVEENAEKEKLLSEGFQEWNKTEFYAFVQGCEKYTRKALPQISKHIGTKSLEEVEHYAKAFWERFPSTSDGPRIIKNIEKGEQHIRQQKRNVELIQKKCSSYQNPKEEFEFSSHYNKFKDKNFSIEHDKLLVYFAFKEGMNSLEKIKQNMKQESIFRFDHFLRSRSEQDLKKRLIKLIKVLEKEETELKNAKPQIEIPRKEIPTHFKSLQPRDTAIIASKASNHANNYHQQSILETFRKKICGQLGGTNIYKNVQQSQSQTQGQDNPLQNISKKKIKLKQKQGASQKGNNQSNESPILLQKQFQQQSSIQNYIKKVSKEENSQNHQQEDMKIQENVEQKQNDKIQIIIDE